MPKQALNPSQMMTIGANVTASFSVPKGWTTKSRIKMPQVVPTIVDCLIPGTTTFSPCTAPRTDWAGVRTPSDMTIELLEVRGVTWHFTWTRTYTASTPIVFSRPLANLLFSRRERTLRFARSRSPERYLSILIRDASRGSRFVMFAWMVSVRQDPHLVWGTHESWEQGIGAESSTFALVICMENDQNVFDLNRQHKALRNLRFLTVTIIVRVQMMIDKTPTKSWWEGGELKVDE